jgi:LmbE family N-acetylglucosaminyl deacetylase
MGPLRQAEQRAAAKELGVSDVRFLGYPDGRLELTLDLRRDISRVIRQVRPQRVLTSSPERWWDRIGASHPDHMTVGESTLRAVYPDARNPFAFPELLADDGLEAWTVSEVWLNGSPRADHAVDVTDVLARKWAALRSWAAGCGRRRSGSACRTAGSPRRSRSCTPPDPPRSRVHRGGARHRIRQGNHFRPPHPGRHLARRLFRLPSETGPTHRRPHRTGAPPRAPPSRRHREPM